MTEIHLALALVPKAMVLLRLEVFRTCQCNRFRFLARLRALVKCMSSGRTRLAVCEASRTKLRMKPVEENKHLVEHRKPRLANRESCGVSRLTMSKGWWRVHIERQHPQRRATQGLRSPQVSNRLRTKLLCITSQR